jgi:hypothetical protein
MHFHFDFSATQVLWTLTFAALLVLLIVLMGRDRVRRFPWFTVATVLMALRLLATRLLFGRMAPMVSSEIFLAMSDLAEIVSILMVVEIARRAFKGAGRVAWISGTLVLLAIAGVVTAEWGPWPSWKTLMAGSELSALRLMQLFAQKSDLFASMLFILLGLLLVLLGRRFGAGWRSHTQQIVIGLSTAAFAQLAVRLIWQEIALHTTIHSQTDYTHVMALQGKFYNANNVVYLAVLVWWIVCLWIDEPGSRAAATAKGVPQSIESSITKGESPTKAESSANELKADS